MPTWIDLMITGFGHRLNRDSLAELRREAKGVGSPRREMKTWIDLVITGFERVPPRKGAQLVGPAAGEAATAPRRSSPPRNAAETARAAFISEVRSSWRPSPPAATTRGAGAKPGFPGGQSAALAAIVLAAAAIGVGIGQLLG